MRNIKNRILGGVLCLIGAMTFGTLVIVGVLAENKRVIDLNMLQEAFLAFVKAVPLIVLGATIFALSVHFLILGLKKIIS